MLIDSLVISLLILQNNCVEINSRRLAKNVILITLTTMNLIGGIMTLLLVSFVYMEYSKFIGRLIFKFIKFIIKIFGNIFPPIYLLYPDIKLFNFEDPDMTIVSNKNNKHKNSIKPTSSDSDSDSDSDSSVQSEKKHIKKKYKKHNKKIIKKKSKKNKLTNNNESTFPTISTIKYDIFKNNNLWTK
jgi:hypothetical protein